MFGGPFSSAECHTLAKRPHDGQETTFTQSKDDRPPQCGMPFGFDVKECASVDGGLRENGNLLGLCVKQTFLGFHCLTLMRNIILVLEIRCEAYPS